MNARKIAAILGLLLLAVGIRFHRGGAAFAQTAERLKIEELSVSTGLPTEDRQVTISFRIVNSGAKIPTSFRARISADGAAPDSSGAALLTIPPLDAGETAFVSHAVSVPAGQPDLDVRVEADTDGILGPGPIVAGGKFIFLPHVPGFWFSIGPTRVHGPAIPATANSRALDPYDATGRLAAIAVHPTNPSVLYVGSPGQLGHEGCGLWKTSNGGKTWTPILESPDIQLSIAAVAIDPTNPERVYVVTSDDGLFRSENGGQVWTKVTSWAPFPSGPQIWRNTDIGDPTVLLIHPDKPNVLFLTSEQGVWRSLDSGKNWDKVLFGGRASSLVMSPIDHDVLYAARYGVGVFRTANATDPGGMTWTKLTMPSANLSPAYGLLLAISAHSSPTRSIETLYALVADSADPATTVLLRTTSAGTAGWEERYRCIPKDSKDKECNFNILSVDPLNADIVYLGGPVLVTSATGIFERVPQPEFYNDRQPASPHGDYHGFAINPLNRAVVYAASDGGIFLSTDHGKTGTWAFIGEGITNAEVYDVAEAASLKSRLIAGTQDNGNIQYDENLVWKHIEPGIYGGDGGLVAIDPIDPDMRYVMTTDGKSLKRWDAASQGFVSFANGILDDCYNWNGTFHFQLFPTNNHFLLASCIKLYNSSTSPSYIWSSEFAPSYPVVRSAIDPKTSRIYAGTDHGELFQRMTGGAFFSIFDNPTGTPVSDIDIDPHHANTVFVSYAPPFVSLKPFNVNRDCRNMSRGNVYQITMPKFVEVTKGGRPYPPTATDISGNLPENLCVNALAVDPVVPQTVYAATNRGVYRGRLTGSRNGLGWVWTRYGIGMPPADVRDLEIHPVTGHMHAATFGRGVLEVILR